MQEPVKYFYKKYGIDNNNVNNVVVGEKYLAVVLNNGNIGVCSTLDHSISFEKQEFDNIDLDKISHRIAANAYFNAVFNYKNKYDCLIDIFDKIDFDKYNNIVMIGFFRSLVNKFSEKKIPLTIFDKKIEDPVLTDMKMQKKHLQTADAVIISGTTIFNNTFTQIINNTTKADIYLLGPSNILHHDIFKYKNIKFVFGAIFNKSDNNLLNIIRNNGCTPEFSPFMKKVYLKK